MDRMLHLTIKADHFNIVCIEAMVELSFDWNHSRKCTIPGDAMHQDIGYATSTGCGENMGTNHTYKSIQKLPILSYCSWKTRKNFEVNLT